jgi:NTE family protein
VSDHVEAEFAKVLYGNKTLQDLPNHPTFVFNASNLQSGVLWRFQKAWMRDYLVGQVISPTLHVAKAVAASAAFPPVLAPCVLKLDPEMVVANDPTKPDPLFYPPYTTHVMLADGGVYDNLGLETAFKSFTSLLVSNAGSPFAFEPKVDINWLGISLRCLDLMDRQVGALRTRLLIENFKQHLRAGAFWAISSDPDLYTCPNAIPCDPKHAAELAAVPTDMDQKSTELQERLINWGYAITDRSIRRHLHTTATPPPGLPYPASGI